MRGLLRIGYRPENFGTLLISDSIYRDVSYSHSLKQYILQECANEEENRLYPFSVPLMVLLCRTLPMSKIMFRSKEVGALQTVLTNSMLACSNLEAQGFLQSGSRDSLAESGSDTNIKKPPAVVSGP